MTRKLPGIFSSRLMACGLMLFLLVTTVSSCTKTKSDPANQKFIGTYNGSNCAGTSVTKIIAAGSDDNSIKFPSNYTNGSCVTNFDVLATVSGNNITIASQSFTVNCGTIILTVSGTGSVNGSTLSLSLAETLVQGSASQSGTECFSGTK